MPPPVDTDSPKMELDSASGSRWWGFRELVKARLKEFIREPEAVFWVYGFPILMTLLLGIAFRNKPIEKFRIDVIEGPEGNRVVAALADKPTFEVKVVSTEESRLRLRTGKTDLQVQASVEPPTNYRYTFDPGRTESALARDKVNDVLQRSLGRKDVGGASNIEFNEPGGRYVDFLVPGLLGMGLMGGGLWGVGYVIVDMRLRKTLKRYLATPLSRSQFLGAIMTSRMLFMVPEIVILLFFSWIFFDVKIYGSWLAVLALILIGAGCFAGIGLAVASRARTIESVNGLMNLVMLPMWTLSGIFFSSERFPDSVQPLIKILPLTALNDSLRAVINEGAPLATQAVPIAVMLIWGTSMFWLGLKLFRWS